MNTIKFAIDLFNSSNTGKSSALLSLLNIFFTSCNGKYTLFKLNDLLVTDANREDCLHTLLKLHNNLILLNKNKEINAANKNTGNYNCNCVFIDRYARSKSKKIAICTAGDSEEISDNNLK